MYNKSLTKTIKGLVNHMIHLRSINLIDNFKLRINNQNEQEPEIDIFFKPIKPIKFIKVKFDVSRKI